MSFWNRKRGKGMSSVQILTEAEARAFDSPPEFSREEQQKYFYLTAQTKSIVEKIRIPANQVGFVLQLGYMKYANRFFTLRTFKKSDILFVSKSLGFKSEAILNNYKTSTADRHRQVILDIMGIQPFDEKAKVILRKEIQHLISLQTRPKQIILNVVEVFQRQKIEIPGYYGVPVSSEPNITLKKNLVDKEHAFW